MFEAAHGRAPAVATGIKRVHPDNLRVHLPGRRRPGLHRHRRRSSTPATAVRSITVIFINNAIYGMTGGQMAPTTLIGQKTTDQPLRPQRRSWSGLPIKVCEMLSQIPDCYYAERVAVNTTANIMKAKKAIKKAFQYQMEGKGFCTSSRSSPPARPTGVCRPSRP